MKKYKGFEYMVFNYMGHYCAYVRLPDNHSYVKLLSKKRWFSIGEGRRHYHYDYDAVPVDCHGGLTFGDKMTTKSESVQGFTNGWWIGWDYAHYGDFMSFAPNLGGKTYQDEEIEVDCKNVIRQLLKVKK